MFREVSGRVVIFCAFALANSARAQEQGHQPVNPEARAIFQQLIEINTTDSVGNVSTAAEAMAQRLLAAGFPEKDVIVAGPDARKKNLVARLRGTGQRKPILFIGHLDVVEAHREDWSMDPFKFIEQDGFFYGRGTEDMKEGDAILVTNFIRLKREGYIETRRVWDGYRSLGFKVRVLNQAKFAPPRQLGLFTPEVTEFSTAFSTERRGKAVGNLLKPAAAWGQEVAPLRGQEVAPRSKTDKSYETTNSIAPPARVTPPRWKSAKARQILAEIERYRAAYIGCSREDLEHLTGLYPS